MAYRNHGTLPPLPHTSFIPFIESYFAPYLDTPFNPDTDDDWMLERLTDHETSIRT
jgi:hypothetical protein